MARFLLALVILATVAGCTSRIEGETNTPPPKGGPGGSERHPPGLTDAEKQKDASK